MQKQKTVNKFVREERFGRLYTPNGGRIPATRLTGKRGNKGRETVSYFRDGAAAAEQAESSVPYYDVYERYAPAAESAMNREDIPTAYKKQIKDYFEALRPAGGGTTAGKKER